MNPILASEGRRRMRSWRTPILLMVLGSIMLLFCYWFQLSILTQSDISLFDMQRGVSGYAILLVLQFVLIIMVAPIMTAGSIAGERERQTLDLLLVTNTGSLRIVLGKLLESFAFLALLIVGVMPISCSALLYGNLDLVRISISTLFMLVTAFAALSVGMLCSVLFKRTVTASILSYFALLAIGVFTLIPLAFMRDDRLLKALAATSGSELARQMPLSLWLNPGLGLLALINTQTGLMMNMLQGYSVTGGAVFDLIGQVGLSYFTWINMGAMCALSMLLILISALFVRPRTGRRRRRERKAVYEAR